MAVPTAIQGGVRNRAVSWRSRSVVGGVSGGRDVGLVVGVASLKCGDFVYPRALLLLPAVR